MTNVSVRPKFTEQQAAAIETRGVSIALSAGAGCGKTFVLTQRFLKGLEPGIDSAELHSLVAITFTDKAAREMRDRIRSACNQRLQQCESDEVDHWLGILRGLDSARVSTIHSFCTSLLRSQAVEAGLDPRFTVLEPALADTLLRNTAQETLHRLLEQGDVDSSAFVLQFGLERARDLLRALAQQRFQIDFAMFAALTPDMLIAQWRSLWETVFVPKLIAEFRAAPYMQRTFELLRDNETTAPAMKGRRLALLEWLEPNNPWRLAVPSLEVIVENARIQGSTAKHWPDAEVYEAVKNGLTDVREAAKKLLDLLPVNEDDLQLAAEFSCRALRLARQTSEAYEAAKQTQGLLDFDDLLLQARDLLSRQPDVRHRVAAGIRLLMVDEFQDTDPVQADVVRMLCGQALTHGRLFLVGDAKQSIYRFRRADPGVFSKLREEIPQPGRLPLTVNFRSQPAILHFVNHLFAASMGESYESLTPFDPVQYSPTPSIEFLFATFDTGSTISPSEGRESPVAEGTGGESAAVGDAGRMKASAAELRTREADWIARRCAELLADPTPRIRAKDAAGRMSLRRVESGDIVILFRALSNVQEYETALRNYGLDYYLVGGKAFFAQQEVFDLLNLCRYLDDPDDLIGLVGILRSPFFNLSDDAIQAISASTPVGGNETYSPNANGVGANRLQSEIVTHAAAEAAKREGPLKFRVDGQTHSLHDKLLLAPTPVFLDEVQQRRIGFARDILTELRSVKDRMPLSKLLTRAVELTGYDAALLAEHLGSRKVANLRKLIEMARQFDQGELFTLKDFVERLHTSVLEETDEEFATTLPETGRVIRLMSIHQSKGLEFPVVIVADIDRKGPPRGRSAVLHSDFGALVKLPDQFGTSHEHLGLRMFSLLEKEADSEETIRLFYVACTRAADYLILSAGIESDAKRNSQWIELVESRFDLRTGLLKTDALLGSSAAGTAGRESISDILSHKQPPAAKPVSREGERQVPLADLTDLILYAEPTEPPASARQWPRDASDLPPISVSRFEEIDAQSSHLAGRDERVTGQATKSNTAQTLSQPPRGRSLPVAERQGYRADEERTPVDPDQATALGTLVHAVLEHVDFANPTNWQTLLERTAMASKDQVSEDALSSARAMLLQFFSSSLVQELASAKSLHREVEFALQISSAPVPSPLTSGERGGVDSSEQTGTLAGSGTRIVGKIDLLYEDARGGWQILDYKTNDIAADATDEQLLAPYELQLGLYAYAVEEWLKEPPRSVSLVMLRPLVRRVTLEWTPGRRAQLSDRITQGLAVLHSPP